MMRKFRKKPIVIEAVQMTEPFTTQTLEGELKGNAGDWLITGIEGEQYPCDNAIFQQTYDPVDTEGRTVTDALAELAPQRIKQLEAQHTQDLGDMLEVMAERDWLQRYFDLFNEACALCAIRLAPEGCPAIATVNAIIEAGAGPEETADMPETEMLVDSLPASMELHCAKCNYRFRLIVKDVGPAQSERQGATAEPEEASDE